MTSESITESDNESREVTRPSIPSGSHVLLGKRPMPSEELSISKNLLNWTLQPLDSEDNITKILNLQSEVGKDPSSGGGGQKIFLPPPEDESCNEDRRLVIDT